MYSFFNCRLSIHLCITCVQFLTSMAIPYLKHSMSNPCQTISNTCTRGRILQMKVYRHRHVCSCFICSLNFQNKLPVCNEGNNRRFTKQMQYMRVMGLFSFPSCCVRFICVVISNIFTKVRVFECVDLYHTHVYARQTVEHAVFS